MYKDETVVVLDSKNDTVSMDCDMVGGKWWKDGMPLNSTEGVSVYRYEFNNTLVISTFGHPKFDLIYGDYSCRTEKDSSDYKVVSE